MSDRIRQDFQNNLNDPYRLTTNLDSIPVTTSIQEQTMAQILAMKSNQEPPVEIATRFAALAEQQEAAKNFQLAEEYNLSASQYYCEAMALMKQKPDFDQKALTTLELLSDTHRRKAKLIGKRKEWGVGHVRNKLDSMIKDQRDLKRAMNAKDGSSISNPLIERDKQLIQEREKYMMRMREQMLIVQLDMMIESKKALETLVEYQKEKLSKFENRFGEVLNTFKKTFNDVTKDFVLSHGEKFVSVKTNPFAKEAIKESINVEKIEKANLKMDKLIQALQKFGKSMNEKLSKVVVKLEEATSKDQSFQISFGQLTAIAASPIGQSIGLNSLLTNEDREILSQMKRQETNNDLQESILGGAQERSAFGQRANSFAGGMIEPMFECKPQNYTGKDAYIEQIRKMEATIKQLDGEKQELNRKYRKYYNYTLKHQNQMQNMPKTGNDADPQGSTPKKQDQQKK
eukprot:403364764